VVKKIDLGTQGKAFGHIIPNLRLGKKTKPFSVQVFGIVIALVPVERIQFGIPDEFKLIMPKSLAPIKRRQEIMAGFCKAIVVVQKQHIEPGALPRKGIRCAKAKSIADIITVLPGLRNAHSSAILNGKEDLWLPKTKALSNLHKELAYIVICAVKVSLHFKQKRTWFDEGFARILRFEIFKIEGWEIGFIVRGIHSMPEIIMEL
jgi:hypothetical protein